MQPSNDEASLNMMSERRQDGNGNSSIPFSEDPQNLAVRPSSLMIKLLDSSRLYFA